MFGFTVYASIDGAGEDGRSFPAKGDKVAGGHAVMAVGYEDALEIPNRDGKTKGAILIRNSWGKGWGERGYGWLVRLRHGGLADDWWVLIDSEWVDTASSRRSRAQAVAGFRWPLSSCRTIRHGAQCPSPPASRPPDARPRRRAPGRPGPRPARRAAPAAARRSRAGASEEEELFSLSCSAVER